MDQSKKDVLTTLQEGRAFFRAGWLLFPPASGLASSVYF
jgi:hypothetical protein